MTDLVDVKVRLATALDALISAHDIAHAMLGSGDGTLNLCLRQSVERLELAVERCDVVLRQRGGHR
jgi:hypothetical protein